MKSPAAERPTNETGVRTSDECKWLRPGSAWTQRSCSKDFCDWVHPKFLDRCFYRSEHPPNDDDRFRYANVTATDFKRGAPAECRMCLPYIDCGAIDRYCHKQDLMQRNAIFAICGAFFLVTMAALLASWLKKRYQRKALRNRLNNPEMTISYYDGAGGLDGAYELANLAASHRHSRRILVLQTAQQAAREIEANEQRRVEDRTRRTNTL